MFSNPGKSCQNKFHPNLKMVVVVMCDDCTRCLVLTKCVSIYDFEDVKTKFKNQIEKEFEDQLDHHVELVDMI